MRIDETRWIGTEDEAIVRLRGPASITRRDALFLTLGVLALPVGGLVSRIARAGVLAPLTVWKDASCGCCGGWVRHMEQAGFTVTVHETDDMDTIKRARGVPDALRSCHTAIVDGYVVEGHVPAEDVKRLLADRTEAKGVAAPGMPQSAPGMGQPGEPYTVVLFGTPTGDRLYATH